MQSLQLTCTMPAAIAMLVMRHRLGALQIAKSILARGRLDILHTPWESRVGTQQQRRHAGKRGCEATASEIIVLAWAFTSAGPAAVSAPHGAAACPDARPEGSELALGRCRLLQYCRHHSEAGAKAPAHSQLAHAGRHTSRPSSQVQSQAYTACLIMQFQASSIHQLLCHILSASQ